MRRQVILWSLALALLWMVAGPAMAQQEIPSIELPSITINGAKQAETAEVSTFLQVMFFLTILSLAPYILVMSTAFIRIVITLSFLRTALGTQQVPPTQVLMGLALFLTMFVMAPVGIKANETAIQPYLRGDIKQAEFVKKLLATTSIFSWSFPTTRFAPRPPTRSRSTWCCLPLCSLRSRPPSRSDFCSTCRFW
jgi:flagellar biosynthetic protein FliP